jgi:hypothetical protein
MLLLYIVKEKISEQKLCIIRNNANLIIMH